MDKKVVAAILPKELAEKIETVPFYPDGILDDGRKRSSNCRYLLTRALDRHICKDSLSLKEPIVLNMTTYKYEKQVGFYISSKTDRELEALKQYYLVSKKTLVSLLICQEADRQERRGDR